MNVARKKRGCWFLAVVCILGCALAFSGVVLYRFQPSLHVIALRYLRGDVPDMSLGNRKIWMPKWFYVKRYMTPEERAPHLVGAFYTPWRPNDGFNHIGVGLVHYKKPDPQLLADLGEKLLQEIDKADPTTIRSRLISTGDGKIAVIRGTKQERLILSFFLPEKSLGITFQGSPRALGVFSRFLEKNGFSEGLRAILLDEWCLTQ